MAFERSPLPFEVTVALQSLGHRIAVTRKQRGHTQAQFADMLGISNQTLVFIEQGRPTVQIGHYLRALWMLEIGDAVLNVVAVPLADPE
jgi:DNA-binding XRE family transcriptional regulator